jgi:hypothetical protein
MKRDVRALLLKSGRTSTLCINLGYHGIYKTAFPNLMLDVLRIRIKTYSYPALPRLKLVFTTFKNHI